MFAEKEFKKMEELGKIFESLELLKELLPPMKITILKIKDKEYIAILFERQKK